ncbi:amidohydrolase family protein [Yinghuangia aomiensis]
MDTQGLDKTWLFPTLGMIYEDALKHDPKAVGHLFRSFNRWLEEDWGWNYQDRIFAAPYIALADLDTALADLDRALESGCRVVCMRPAAPTTADGPFTPGDPVFDPFWARVNEAGIPVVVHAGDSGYSANGYSRKQGLSTDFKDTASRRSPCCGRWSARSTTSRASLILDRVFHRFPNVRVVSVENGSEFLGDLFRKLRSVNRKVPGLFPEDPVETFKRHIWINPFWEDDVHETVETHGRRPGSSSAPTGRTPRRCRTPGLRDRGQGLRRGDPRQDHGPQCGGTRPRRARPGVHPARQVHPARYGCSLRRS